MELFAYFRKDAGHRLTKQQQELPGIVEDFINSENTCYSDERLILCYFDKSVFDKQSFFVKTDNSNYVVLYAGCMNNYTELVRSKSDNDFGTNVIRLYQDYGNKLFEKINGRFTIVIWDKRNHKLTVATDRYGFKNVYYKLKGDGIVISTELQAVIEGKQVEKALDPSSLHDFINHHYITDTKTFFESVSILPNGSYLSIKKNSVDIVRYWEYPTIRESNQTYDDLLDEAQQLITKAIDRSIISVGSEIKVASLLSGGLDSRLITANLFENTGFDVSLFHGDTAKYESRIASDVANAIGKDLTIHNLYNTDHEHLLKILEKHTSGELSSHQLWLYDLIDTIHNKGYTNTFDGVLLDVIFSTSPFVSRQNVFISNLQEKARKISEIYPIIPRALMERYFTKDFANNHEEICISNFCRQLSFYEGDNMIDISKYYYYTTRGRRYIWPMLNLHSKKFNLCCPGFDNELFEFSYKIPRDYSIGGEFYKSIFKKYYPKLFEIPWAMTKKPLSKKESRLEKAFKTAVDNYKFYVRRLSKGGIDYGSPASFDRRFRKDLKFRHAYLNILNDDRTYSRLHTTREGIENLIRDMDSGRNYFNFIESLVTLELFIRKYID